MKESGMDKLIELLNEFNEGGHWRDENFNANKLLVISKEYGFIGWLVDNDKINLNDSKLLDLSTELGCAVSSDIVIMVLSIQDNPIEFLISILKIS